MPQPKPAKFATFLVVALVGLIGSAQMASAEDKQTPSQPNFVFIISDDQGWNDMGYHGSEVQTPTLDRLAASGVRLGRHYVYPTCSPTRAAMLTGRNPSRFGVLSPIAGRSEKALPQDPPTLAALLSKHGYDTALTGKWHLGLRPEVGPRQYGFHSTYGYLHGQIDQYSHEYKNGDRSWHRNDKFIDEKGHATDLITAEAVRFIEAERDKPFFLYVAYSVPHHPVQEPEEWLSNYDGKIENESRRAFAASITHMDAGIEKIMQALQKTGQQDRTLVVYTSDNGGQKDWSSGTQYGGRHKPNPVLGNNKPWRGWKGELYEGGVRVPALAYWPGKLRPSQVNSTLHITDWYPTFAALAHVEVPQSWEVEGADVWPVLKGDEPTGSRQVYWRTPGEVSLLDGDWKLIGNHQLSRLQLFNLATDPYEQQDLIQTEPQKLAQLKQKLEQQMARDE